MLLNCLITGKDYLKVDLDSDETDPPPAYSELEGTAH